MPGMKTHDLFGILAAKEGFPAHLQESVGMYPAAFHIGLQGPDLFFYSVAPWTSFPLNPGNAMHRYATGTFFARLFDVRALLSEGEKRIADAYICGFIGHYTLDCICHPYVYHRTKHLSHDGLGTYDFGMHVFLETDMDNACVRHYTGLGANDYGIETQLSASPEEKQVITELVYRAMHAAYEHFDEPVEEQEKVRAAGRIQRRHIRQSLDLLPVTAKLLKDPSGRKKLFLRTVEQYFVGYAVISGMLSVPGFEKYPDPCNEEHHPWRNPWDPAKEERTESVYDLMDAAAAELRQRARLYEQAAKASDAAEDSAEAKEAWMPLRQALGSRAYGSGE